MAAGYRDILQLQGLWLPIGPAVAPSGDIRALALGLPLVIRRVGGQTGIPPVPPDPVVPGATGGWLTPLEIARLRARSPRRRELAAPDDAASLEPLAPERLPEPSPPENLSLAAPSTPSVEDEEFHSLRLKILAQAGQQLARYHAARITQMRLNALAMAQRMTEEEDACLLWLLGILDE